MKIMQERHDHGARSTSMWTSGLRLILPKDCAVGSPWRSAAQAWADSWTDRLKSSTT